MSLTPKSYRVEATIVPREEDCETVILVHSGWGRLSVALADGGRQIIDFLLPGDLIEFRSVARGNQLSLTAVTAIDVFTAPLKFMCRALSRSDRVTGLLIDACTRRRAIMAEHMANLGRRSAFVRTAHLFLELSTRLDAAGVQTQEGFTCPLTQYDLADALGLTPIHINRMLRELRERELLSFRHGEVEWLNRRSLIMITDYNGAYAQ